MKINVAWLEASVVGGFCEKIPEGSPRRAFVGSAQKPLICVVMVGSSPQRKLPNEPVALARVSVTCVPSVIPLTRKRSNGPSKLKVGGGAEALKACQTASVLDV